MRGVSVVVIGLGLAFGSAGVSARTEADSDIAGAADVAMDTTLDQSSAEAGLSSIADAHAQFAPVLTPAPDFSLGEWSNHLLVYAGLDGWRLGGSAYIGSEWSPGSDSPFILRAFASDGIDDYKTPFGTLRVETARASLLPGYRIKSGTLEVKLFVGGDFMLRSLLRPAINAWKESYGIRTSADVWWEPLKDWMLSGSLSATTIERGISGRLASGWRSPFGWVGPEFLATQDVFNTQWRAGGHVSGIQVGMTEWSVAGGYTQDSFGRSGPYGRLGISYRSLP